MNKKHHASLKFVEWYKQYIANTFENNVKLTLIYREQEMCYKKTNRHKLKLKECPEMNLSQNFRIIPYQTTK